jgi:hypothetical protein
LELLYLEYESKQREYSDGRLFIFGGFSLPHVLEEAAALRALAAKWGGTGCCCPGVLAPTL